MSSKLVKLGSLLLTGVLVSIGASAHAGNINTSGVICQNFNAAQALDIDYFTNGVRNINIAPRSVICSVPRSPLPANAHLQFFVDGHNNPGTSTSCTVAVYDFLGAGLMTQSFTITMPSTAPPPSLDWDQLVSFPTITSPGDMFDYVSVLCTLPGSGAGLIHGVTAVQ
jgi:hypothetical protein